MIENIMGKGRWLLLHGSSRYFSSKEAEIAGTSKHYFLFISGSSIVKFDQTLVN